MTLPARFWAKVNKSGPVPAHRPRLGPCWVWMGARTSKGPKGYGLWNRGTPSRVPYLVHRSTYEDTAGPIPEGLDLDHLCRTRLCCNPSHVEPVTRRTNIVRGLDFRILSAHCRNGHLYDDSNTAYEKTRIPGRQGRRRCKACAAAAQERHRDRNVR
jgi:HNH endonuclease